MIAHLVLPVRWRDIGILLMPQQPFEYAFGVFAADKKNLDKKKPNAPHRPTQGAASWPG